MTPTTDFANTSELFRLAVSAVDTGDVSALEQLLADNPTLMSQRLEWAEYSSRTTTRSPHLSVPNSEFRDREAISLPIAQPPGARLAGH